MTIHRPIRDTEPAVSVVVPTVPANSYDELVSSLEDQTVSNFELCVVEDADLDICEARNAGIERANGEIVALTDDDCEPPETWVESIEAAFEADDSLVLVEGPVRGGRTYSGTRKYVGCNLAFNRSVALSVGGFRSAYAGWRDDTEFGWRVELDSDGKCEYRPEIVMHHPDRPRAVIDDEMEKSLKNEYPKRYEELIEPDTVVGSINDWLWRNGFWDAVDRIRFR